MKRKDCAYCIDLDEQGALCDHPLHWCCGEPVEARCSSRCADYERRISVIEALSRIHNLEAKLAESEKYRARYADVLIPIMAENAKLREQMERLVTLLRVDCDIDASWDGLRRFWSIELTESGCLIRDRACKAEAENAKQRELLCELYEDQCDEHDRWRYRDRMRELGIEVD